MTLGTRTKRAVNDLLRRSTGYQLVKDPYSVSQASEPEQRLHEIVDAAARHAEDARNAALQARQAAEEAATPEAAAEPEPPAESKPKPKPKREFPEDYDDEIAELIRQVRPWTMTHNDKIHTLHASVKYVMRYGIPGAFVECGVWRGGSTQAAALTFLAGGVTDRDLYMFDTFEGMPPPTERDRRFDDTTAAELMDKHEKDARIWAYASLDDVKSGMEAINYPSERIHYVQGLVEDTIPEHAPDQIAILRLDTDWYESTAHELKHLYPRLAPGGVLIIDDYGWWKGSREATDEFLEASGEPLLLIRAASGRIAVKPHR